MIRKTEPNVLWTEGLLMAPPHLQQSDRYHEALLSARIEAIAPISWGVLRCEIDRHALAEGTLRIDELALVTAEGTVIVIDRDHPEAPPARPVDRAALERGSVPVLLAIPSERDGVTVVGNAGAEPWTPQLEMPPVPIDLLGGPMAPTGPTVPPGELAVILASPDPDRTRY